MKKTIFLLATTLTLLSFKPPAPEWIFDGAHSNLMFSIGHLMVSDVIGTFKITELTMTTPNEDFSDAQVMMSADVKSVDTDIDARDAHLQKADLLDAEKYPAITFRSTSFKKISDRKYSVTGDLTMHGVTKQVTLDATAATGINPYDSKTVAGFKATTTIKRTEFGIAPTTPSAMLSDEIYIQANLAFVKK